MSSSSGAARDPRAAVCHAITMLELGGAQQNTLYTVGHLDPTRFRAMLVAGPGGILDADAARLPGVAFETCPHLVRPVAPLQDLQALWDLWRRFRRLRPTIVHTHSSKAGIVGRLAAFLAGTPVIVHSVHGWGFHPRQRSAERVLFTLLEWTAALVTSRLVAVSTANAQRGAALGIAPLERFTVIRSGIELAAHRAAADNGRLRSELGLAPDTPLAGMVACLKPQKAPLDFVAVAARVAAQVPGSHFVFAGDGELRAQLEQAVGAAGLRGRFHALGWRRDPEFIVGDLSVLVLTSLHEGLPRVVPEAMAAGRPVVATAVDGTPEAVRDGVTGFLHPPGDVEGLAASTARLLVDRELARAMGAKARTLVDEWDIDEMVRRQEDMYEELLREAGIPAPVAAANG